MGHDVATDAVSGGAGPAAENPVPSQVRCIDKDRDERSVSFQSFRVREVTEESALRVVAFHGFLGAFGPL